MISLALVCLTLGLLTLIPLCLGSIATIAGASMGLLSLAVWVLHAQYAYAVSNVNKARALYDTLAMERGWVRKEEQRKQAKWAARRAQEQADIKALQAQHVLLEKENEAWSKAFDECLATGAVNNRRMGQRMKAHGIKI